MMEKLLANDVDIKKISDITYNYNKIRENIANAAIKCGRKPEDITFLSATKTVAPVYINHAISLGLDHIGENKVQELTEKFESYDLKKCSLQFIGHLQTNKVRQIIGKVDMIQSVDSEKLALEIASQSIKKGINTDVLVEVNIGEEENKSGVYVENLLEFLEKISVINGISVKGLMTIPPICQNKADVRKFFEKMYKLFIDISAKKLDNIYMSCLSMGMSDDYEEAILEGATMVRIGSALFGARNYNT